MKASYTCRLRHVILPAMPCIIFRNLKLSSQEHLQGRGLQGGHAGGGPEDPHGHTGECPVKTKLDLHLHHHVC